MPNLEVQPGWPAARQLDRDEFASGGPNGNLNEHAKVFLARTEFLKNREYSSSYDLMSKDQITALKAGSSTDDFALIIQRSISEKSDDVIIKAGTYSIGENGIQLSGIANKRIIFENGALLKWHTSVTFSSLRKMISLTNCSNIEFVNLKIQGNNNPSIWVKTEKVIRAGLVDKQTGVFISGSKNIKFTAPDVQNFQWGIHTLASGASKTTDIKINDGYLSGNYCGIVWESYIIDGITDCTVTNTKSMKNWKWGMWMEAGDLSKDSRYIRGIKVSGGSFSEQVEEHGIYVQGQEHSFTGVDFNSNNTAGLRMLACGGLQVIGCRFKDNGWNRNGIGYPAGAAFIGDDTSTTEIYKRANNVIFSNNISIENRFTFIDYKLDNGVVVSDNSCFRNGAAGVDGDIVFRSNQNSKISNNIIRDSKCDVGILVRDQGNSMSKNIDVDGNVVIGQVGVGIKYSWAASATDSEMIRIRGNTVKNATSHGIVIELMARETRFVEVTGNNVSWCGSVGIKTYAAATATCSYMRVTGNSSIHNTSYGIEYSGESSSAVYGLLDSDNIVYRNNSNGLQKFQSGGGYATANYVEYGNRTRLMFKASAVANGTGEIALLFEGVAPFFRAFSSGRVKSIEMYSSKGVISGTVTGALKTYTGNPNGTKVLSSSFDTTIPVNQNERYVISAMNAANDRLLLGNRYYIGVDLTNAVFTSGITDLFCILTVDFVDDWRFETVIL